MTVTRFPTANDLRRVLSLCPNNMGVEELGPENALRAWLSLAEAEGFQSFIAEKEGPQGERRILAFGASICVTDSFVESEMASDHPGMVQRLLSDLVESRNHVLCSRDQVSEANSSDGLNVAVLIGRWIECCSEAEEIEARHLLVSQFSRLHAGHYFRRMVCEVRDQQDYDFQFSTKIFRTVKTYKTAGNGFAPLLAVIEREDVIHQPGTVLTPLFLRSWPRARLRPVEQDLLLAATLSGATDPEISKSLGISEPMLKKHWASILEQMEQAYPESFRGVKDSEGGKRGGQKRHRVLTLIRENPQEIRPYRLKPFTEL